MIEANGYSYKCSMQKPCECIFDQEKDKCSHATKIKEGILLRDKRFKMKYLKNELDTSPIQNFKSYNDALYSSDYFISEKKRVETMTKSSVVLRDNRAHMRRAFGKACFTTGKELEFNFSCWLFKFGNSKVLVMTAGTKGTCIELVTSETHDDADAYDFYEWLYTKLK